MPIPEQFRAPFYPQCYYHVLFRSVDGLMLFHNPLNRDFFLNKFSHFVHPVLYCLAYCLLDNHVHFIVRIRTCDAILRSLTVIPEEARTKAMRKFIAAAGEEFTLSALIERQINSFTVSYVNTFNKGTRKGGLFQSPFRRLQIMDDAHLQQAIINTHANAQKHGMINDFKEYKFSSYWEIINGLSTNVNVNEVLSFFGDKEKYILQHQQQVDHFYRNNWPSSRLESDE